MLLTGNGIGNLGDPFFMLGFADLDNAPAVTALDELVQGSHGRTVEALAHFFGFRIDGCQLLPFLIRFQMIVSSLPAIAQEQSRPHPHQLEIFQ